MSATLPLLAYHGGMADSTQKQSLAGSLLKRLIALVVLLVAGYILFKVVLGFIAGFFTLIVVIVAVLAVLWAYSTLKRR